MTKISLTSGEVLDVISSLTSRGNAAFDSQEYHLADYYFKIAYQFEKVSEKLKEMIPEERVAELVLQNASQKSTS